MKYNWNADDYAENSSAQQQWAEELIAKLALSGRESVIDIGCGDGRTTAQFARMVNDGRVLGIDSSESMIRRASAQFPASAIPNLSFRQMDATEIRLGEKFDIAFSNATLHWVKDQIAVLNGVHSCLKTGGKILFQMGGSGNAAGVFDAVREVTCSPKWERYFEGLPSPYHFHVPEDYRVWLGEAGFLPSRVELIPKDMQHEGPVGLASWLRTTWFPYTDRVPAEHREALLGELVETYLAAHPVDDAGRTHVGMVRLEVEASAL
jgi:trans-aconitate 2-methyltransferase